MRQVKDVLWTGINEIPVPDYLSDNIDRILTVTSEDYLTNEAFFWIIIDQILISAVYEKNHTQTTQQSAPSQSEDHAVLELQHETQFQRQVTYERKTRLLSEYADYNPATNLIIIGVKKINSVNTCLDPLTAYMGVMHAYRKDEQKEDSSTARLLMIFHFASVGSTMRAIEAKAV